MTDKPENPTAFPRYGSGPHGAACNTTFEPIGGLTLRDYFAAAALRCIEGREDYLPYDMQDWQKKYDFIARHAYGIAEAMLAERVK